MFLRATGRLFGRQPPSSYFPTHSKPIYNLGFKWYIAERRQILLRYVQSMAINSNCWWCVKCSKDRFGFLKKKDQKSQNCSPSTTHKSHIKFNNETRCYLIFPLQSDGVVVGYIWRQWLARPKLDWRDEWIACCCCRNKR